MKQSRVHNSSKSIFDPFSTGTFIDNNLSATLDVDDNVADLRLLSRSKFLLLHLLLLQFKIYINAYLTPSTLYTNLCA